MSHYSFVILFQLPLHVCEHCSPDYKSVFDFSSCFYGTFSSVIPGCFLVLLSSVCEEYFSEVTSSAKVRVSKSAL